MISTLKDPRHLDLYWRVILAEKAFGAPATVEQIRNAWMLPTPLPQNPAGLTSRQAVLRVMGELEALGFVRVDMTRPARCTRTPLAHAFHITMSEQALVDTIDFLETHPPRGDVQWAHHPSFDVDQLISFSDHYDATAFALALCPPWVST